MIDYRRNFAFLLFILVSCGSSAALCQSSIVMDASAKSQDITSQLQVGFSSPEEQDPASLQFRNLEKAEIHKDYSPQDLWIKIVVSNSSPSNQSKLLVLDSPLAGQLTLFKEGDKSHTSSSGPGLPLEERSYASRLGAFLISLSPNETAQYIIRRSSHHALNSRLFLMDPDELERNESQNKSIFFFYIGGIFSLVVYNFVIGLFAKQNDHLIYAFFAASFGVTAMTLHGVFDTYLLPNNIFVFSKYLMFFSGLSLFSASLFVEKFLNIKRDFQVGFWGLRLISGLAAISMCASLFVPYFRELFFFGYWIDISIAVGILFFIFCGFYSLTKRNFAPAYFFLLSWIVIFIGISLWFASVHGFISITPVIRYSLLLANLGEMLVLSLGLAYKIKTLDAEKRAALSAANEKERYHRLVKVLAHDVANAVSGMMYHSEMLEDLCADQALTGHIQSISKGTGKLNDILKSVREEEVFFSFKAHSDIQPVKLSEACHEAVKHYSWELSEKNIQVNIDIPENLCVRADRSALINQVLSNLISNSIKFSQPNKSIHFLASCKVHEAALSIRDEGCGVLPEDLPHLFKGKKLFSYKGTANEKGTGLGSSLVGEYMNIFGGRIEVESVHQTQSEKSGTTVRLFFPLIANH